MRVEPTSRRHLNEQRRYFPDWTDRLLESGQEVESVDNSYLAGGYAEEFGYRAQPGWSRGVPVLDAESPELFREWRCQSRAAHPGYPLKPHPFADDLDSAMSERDATAASGHVPEHDLSTREPLDTENHGTFVTVSSLLHERAARARSAAIIATRLAAALVSLRWALRNR